jgi:hypothetical protein
MYNLNTLGFLPSPLDRHIEHTLREADLARVVDAERQIADEARRQSAYVENIRRSQEAASSAAILEELVRAETHAGQRDRLLAEARALACASSSVGDTLAHFHLFYLP